MAGDADYLIDSVGKDVRPLRTSGNWWSVPAVTVVPTSTSYSLASTQDHFRMDEVGRDEINQRMAPQGEMIREGSYASYQEFLKQHPVGARRSGRGPASRTRRHEQPNPPVMMITGTRPTGRKVIICISRISI